MTESEWPLNEEWKRRIRLAGPSGSIGAGFDLISELEAQVERLAHEHEALGAIILRMERTYSLASDAVKRKTGYALAGMTTNGENEQVILMGTGQQDVLSAALTDLLEVVTTDVGAARTADAVVQARAALAAGLSTTSGRIAARDQEALAILAADPPQL